MDTDLLLMFFYGVIAGIGVAQIIAALIRR